MQRIVFSIIFLLTVAITITLQNNFLILSLLLLVWAVPYRYYKKTDILFFGFGTISFLILDTVVVKNDVFHFSRPDFFGLPAYEPFLWGFYLVTINKIGAAKEELIPHRGPCIVMILVMLSTFLIFKTNLYLFLTQAFILAVTFLFWHKKSDISYTLIAIALGAIVEYSNVVAGNWFYPGGGVPIWFLTFWAAVGLLDNRLLRANCIAAPAPSIEEKLK